MIGGKVRSSKRMSPRKSKSPKRKSSKRKSPKTSAWIRKLSAWRKANRHVDGSLPSMKSAMKHCKGRSSRKTNCRKNQGRKPSPKRSTMKRKSVVKKSKSPKRKSASKKTKSPKRKTSAKKKSPKRKSAAKKAKSPKKRSYTRKPKAMPLLSAQRDELSQFRRYGPRLQQAANALATTNAPFAGPAKKYQPQQQLSPLFGQALPQGLQNFQQQQGPMFGPQTRQQSQARQARQAFEQLPGANTKQEQGGLLGLFGF